MKKFVKKTVKFFLYSAGFILVLLLGLYFLRNILLDFAIEKGGTKLNGAKVEVYDVNLDLFSQSISWQKLEAADKNNPWRNLIETGFTEFGIQVMPLTGGKIIIDSMTLNELQSNTKRKTDGSIPKSKKSLNEDDKDSSWVKDFALKQLEKEKNAVPVLNKEFLKDFSNTDKIIEDLDLVTPKKVDEAKAYIEERKIFWNNRFEKRNYEKRAKEIEKDFREIKSSDTKKPQEVLAAIEKIQDLKEKCESFKNDLKEDRLIAKKDLETINQYKKNFPQWVKSDYEKAANSVSIKGGGLEKISEMLFGKRLTSAAQKLINITAQIRQSAKKPKKETKPEKPVQDKYPHLPKFWIKKSEVSVLLAENNYGFKGKVLNISSDQDKTGQPVTFDFLHNDEKTGKISFDGIIDFRKSSDLISFDLNCANFVLNNLKLSSDDLVPLVLKSGKADIQSSFVSRPEQIEFRGDFKIKEQVFDKSVSKDLSTLEKLVFDAAESAEQIDIELLVNLYKDKKNISVKSSLGSLVSESINDYVRTKADKEIKKVEQSVKLRIEEQRKEFISSSNEGESLISGNISQYENQIENKEDNLNTEKEKLEKKIKSKIDDKKDELLDKLKIKF
jgi:uncharacterized protein (TIGR03545 family)